MKKDKRLKRIWVRNKVLYSQIYLEFAEYDEVFKERE